MKIDYTNVLRYLDIRCIHFIIALKKATPLSNHCYYVSHIFYVLETNYIGNISSGDI